jgi:gas vesicle protein GvpL/GvpF
MTLMRGTYVYCIVASSEQPRRRRGVRGLPDAGPVRLLDVGPGLFLAVADAPLGRYGETAIARGLNDLDWVSRAAVAHERVVESFMDARAVVPFKLFTIFSNDARAVDHVRSQQARIRRVIKRVANHHEWGVRLVLDRNGARRAAPGPVSPASRSGATYLAAKKARRDAMAERAKRARETAAALYDRMASRAQIARRRTAGELPVDTGPLLLDAVFLVPRGRAAGFSALAAREAKALSRRGYGVTLSGPWPPYSFVQD